MWKQRNEEFQEEADRKQRAGGRDENKTEYTKNAEKTEIMQPVATRPEMP